MTQSKRHGSGPPSPPKHRKQSFLHPQETGAVWAYLPALLLVAFVLRATVALSGNSHLHPDELLQYLEPAHRLVFGNGVVCWEYLYGARSWIIPGAIAGVLWLHALVGLDAPAYYIPTVKLVFCTLSLLIPLGMYLFCRRHWSEHSARLALVLGVFWYEFLAFAHKPMTEFVATALILVLLSIMPLHTSACAWRGWAVAGALGALAVAVRFQYAPLIGMILLAGVTRAPVRGWLAMIGGGAVVVGAVGALETWTWGMPFHSYWLNGVFNIEHYKFHEGESTLWQLPWQLLHASCGLLAVAVVGLVGNIRRRGFVGVLLLLVMIPHVLSAHREYRYIFATVPLWLMLFADVLAVTGKHLAQSGTLRRPSLPDAEAPGHGDDRAAPSGVLVSLVGVGAAILVSAAGIVNAIPYQNDIYNSFSGEIIPANFLSDRTPKLELYRRLSDDDSVQGVLDANGYYLDGGGYYYLHRRIPLYDRDLYEAIGGGGDPGRYASHIITRTSVGGGKLVSRHHPETGGTVYAVETGYGDERFPLFIGDPDRRELVYWSKTGQRMRLPGYIYVEQLGDLIVWQRQTVQPLKQWRDYQIIFHPGGIFWRTLVHILGKQALRLMPPHSGIEYADD